MLASNARLNRQKLLDRYASLPKNQSPAGVVESTDGGRTWTKLFGAPLVNSLTVNPRDPDHLYCTVEDGAHGAIIPAVGIYRSADGGKTWNRINRGLAFPWGFMQFVWHPTRNELWLSTYGSGCYKLIDNIQ